MWYRAKNDYLPYFYGEKKLTRRLEGLSGSKEWEISSSELTLSEVLIPVLFASFWSLAWPFFLPFMIYENYKEKKEASDQILVRKQVSDYLNNARHIRENEENNKEMKSDRPMQGGHGSAGSGLQRSSFPNAINSIDENIIDKLNDLRPTFLGHAGLGNLLQRAGLGDKDAQFELGKLYVVGCDQFDFDVERARYYFSLASDSGHQTAKTIIAKINGGAVLKNRFAISKRNQVRNKKTAKSEQEELAQLGITKVEAGYLHEGFVFKNLEDILKIKSDGKR
jgi:hypothetical protein